MDQHDHHLSADLAVRTISRRPESELDDSWFNWAGSPSRSSLAPLAERFRHKQAPLQIGDDLADDWFR